MHIGDEASFIDEYGDMEHGRITHIYPTGDYFIQCENYSQIVSPDAIIKDEAKTEPAESVLDSDEARHLRAEAERSMVYARYNKYLEEQIRKLEES